MRRFICLFLTLLLVFSAFSGAALASGVVDNRRKPDVPQFSPEDFTVEGYLYEGYSSTYYYVAVTNNSQYTVELDFEGTAKDAQLNSIGADSGSIDVLGPGETAMDYLWFSNVTGVSDVDLKLEVSLDPYYLPVLGDIELSQVLNNSNVTVIATNNGSYAARSMCAYAIFFDESGNVIDVDESYITDINSELKPGQTLATQLDFEGEYYESVKVFLDSYGMDKGAKAPEGLTAESLSIAEFPYVSGDSTTWYLAVTNNSDQAIAIRFNGIAYDASDIPIGADFADVEVVGPGQTTFCDFHLYNVKNVARMEYTPSFSADPYYEDVLANLSYECSTNEKNVIVTVTNNGSVPAEYVHGLALFLDDSGKVVYAGTAYFTDDDGEIKPGANITEQINTYKYYSRVGLFFTGRYRAG